LILFAGLVALFLLLSCSAHETHAIDPAKPSLPDDVDLIGHRGAAGLAPENTLAGFRRACEVGVDGLELDVLLTSDRQIVVHHDYGLKPEIARTPDGQWVGDFSRLIVKDLSLAELKKYDVGRLKPYTRYAGRYPESQPADGERIPTLEEVITLLKTSCAPATQLWIEIKTSPEHPDLTPPPEVVAEAVLQSVRTHKISKQVLILSFDWRALVHVQKIAPQIPTVYLSLVGRSLNNIKPGQPGTSPWTAGIDIDDYNGSIPRAVNASGGRYWAQYYKHLTRDDLKTARELGIRVLVWTVDSKSEMLRLIEMGVDGIITNRPDIFDSIRSVSKSE
jgi:glycerophosphoryl diester phosphodiesterase